MINAVDHINLVVSDLEKSVDFYTNLLGFKEVRRAHLEGDWIEKIVGLKDVKAEVAYIVAPEGEPRIELLWYSTPAGESARMNSQANTIGLRHIAFRVDDIQRSFQKLKDAGVTIISEPTTVPASVISHDMGRKTLCYFLDPDGVILEFAEYR